ncbi:MAG: outer membrane lipoprotein-sorting protein, partial [Myxococcota bacterium]
MKPLPGSLPFLCLAFALCPFLDARSALETPDEIAQCMRDNLPHNSSVQSVVLRSTDRTKSVTESRATLHWEKGEDGFSKVLLRFHKPLDLRGAGLLMLEKKGRSPDTFLYLPEIRKVRRVSSRVAASSLFGTDFSYEDFQRLMGMSENADMQREEDTRIEGRAAFVISATFPAESKSTYEKVVTSIDQETCVALAVDSYETGGILRKQLRADVSQISEEGGRW